MMPYTAHQSNHRGYPMPRPGSYNAPAVSTVSGSTIITIPGVAPHSNCTVLKIPAALANITVLTQTEDNNSKAQPQSHTNAYRSPQPKGYSTERVSISHKITTSSSSLSGTGSTPLSVVDGRRKVHTTNHKKGSHLARVSNITIYLTSYTAIASCIINYTWLWLYSLYEKVSYSYSYS